MLYLPAFKELFGSLYTCAKKEIRAIYPWRCPEKESNLPLGDSIDISIDPIVRLKSDDSPWKHQYEEEHQEVFDKFTH